MKRALGVAVLIALAAAGAGATILIKKNLAELSREAEAVVVARVLRNSAAWNDAKTIIWTSTELEIVESWKGGLKDRVVVKEPGGVVWPVGQQVEGMARYAENDTVIVFLSRDVLGQWRTHGCCQGVFRVVPDEDGVPRAQVAPGLGHVVDGWLPKLASGGIRPPDLPSMRAHVESLAGLRRQGR